MREKKKLHTYIYTYISHTHMYIYILEKREIYKINSSKEICIYIYIYLHIYKAREQPPLCTCNFQYFAVRQSLRMKLKSPSRAQAGAAWAAPMMTRLLFLECLHWKALSTVFERLYLSMWAALKSMVLPCYTKTFCKRKQCPGTAKVNNTIQMVLYLPRVLRLLFCFIAGAFEGSRWLNALGVSLLSHFWRKQKPLWDCLKTVDISRIRK